MGQGGERPVFAASESQGGEWAFKRTQKQEYMESCQSIVLTKVNIILMLSLPFG